MVPPLTSRKFVGGSSTCPIAIVTLLSKFTLGEIVLPSLVFIAGLLTLFYMGGFCNLFYMGGSYKPTI